MLYSEKIETFAAAHPCENITVDGAHFRGQAEGLPLFSKNALFPLEKGSGVYYAEPALEYREC